VFYFLIVFIVGFCDHEDDEDEQKEKNDVNDNGGYDIVHVINERGIAFKIHIDVFVGCKYRPFSGLEGGG